MRFRRFALAAVAAVGLCGGLGDVATAADLPGFAPVWNWTGFYAGLNAGGAWGTSNLDATVTGGFGPPNQTLVSGLDTLRLSPNGFTGGGQLGYNYQVGNIVWGLEADFDYSGLNASSDRGPFTYVGGGTFALSNSVKTDWLFTLRPRVGLAFDRFLPYVTGGLAVTDVKYSSSLTDFSGFGASNSNSVNSTKAGWALGGGVEYAVTPTWSVKAEYLYMDFGSVSMTDVSGYGARFSQSASLKANIVRGGINMKF